MEKVDRLRRKHPQFIYESFHWEINGKDLAMSFSFLLVPDIRFRPKVIIKNIDPKRVAELAKKGVIDNFTFHIGLAEIPSYWKAAASPVIEIKAGNLDQFQRAWWEKLICKGMGEYFYVNRIDFTKPDFLAIRSRSGQKRAAPFRRADISKYPDRVLVPMGGGKDSIVTMEVLKQNFSVRCFALNPTRRTQKIIEISKTASPIVAQRAIDPKLRKLNAKGYINGHTPFSSYLAFLSAFCASLFDYRYIALSNERSANEGNIKFYNRVINHQYSKSYEFERDFRIYAKRYLSRSIEYFSFMRPLYELQIARVFAKFPQYFPYVLSCNKGQKTGEWCGACSKCVFVYAILYSFVDHAALRNMFGGDLFQKRKLFSILQELSGIKRHKPFDCVGTAQEMREALHLALKRERGHAYPRPLLLRLADTNNFLQYSDYENVLHAWTNKHFLPRRFTSIIKKLK